MSPSDTVRHDGYPPLVLGTVLIVDDDAGVIQTSSRLLRLAGFCVHTAMSVEAGLREVEYAQPDVILLDLKMPFRDGLFFLRRLRATAQYQWTPVAIVTGEVLPDERIVTEIRELRADLEFKPMFVAELLTVTHRLMRAVRPATRIH